MLFVLFPSFGSFFISSINVSAAFQWNLRTNPSLFFLIHQYIFQILSKGIQRIGFIPVSVIHYKCISLKRKGQFFCREADLHVQTVVRRGFI